MKYDSAIERGMYIRKKRQELGLSCQGLADRIGVSKGFISLLENGKSGIDADNAARLADVLGFDVSAILEDTSKIVDTDPAWLRFLMTEYNLTKDDRQVLQMIVRNTGMPLTISGETPGEYRARWRRFYNEVQKFLSEPTNRFFADQEVRYVLSRLGVAPETDDLDEVRKAFVAIVEAECGKGDGFATMEEWKSHVCRKLGIKIIDVSKKEYRKYSRVNTERIELCQIMVASSDKIYGASCKLLPSGSGYAFVGDSRGSKGFRCDYPFWHEAVRMLVDPELRSGRSISYAADGVQRPPIEELFGRMSVWFAYNFNVAKSILAQMASGDGLSLSHIQKVNQEVFLGATLRMTSMAIVEANPKPMVYIDAQMRLKEAECCVAKISVADQKKMEKHPDAKLRIGFVFKNCAAEKYGVGLRYNMQIGEESPIYVSYCNKKDSIGEESMLDWASRYNLMGFCKTTACYSARENNVRAFMLFEEED